MQIFLICYLVPKCIQLFPIITQRKWYEYYRQNNLPFKNHSKTIHLATYVNELNHLHDVTKNGFKMVYTLFNNIPFTRHQINGLKIVHSRIYS